jgi:glucose-1-phosphate thymidylyltransferase
VGKYLNSSEKQDAPGNYIKWLSKNDAVYAFAFDEAWYDIGSKESLEEVKKIYGGK